MDLVYYDGLSDDFRLFLSVFREGIMQDSINSDLRASASARNKSLVISGGFLIHGSRKCDEFKLESIINNGLLCPEFAGNLEDGETFYHLSLFESPKGVNHFKSVFSNCYSAFLPVNDFCSNIGFIIKPAELMVHVGKSDELESYKYKGLINDKCIPLPYVKDGVNHVGVFGGVPSNNIIGLVLRSKDVNWVKNVLDNAGFYAQLFDNAGVRIY